MALYPSIITAFSYPNPTDRLNNPSHSALENLQSSTIGQLEAVIGLAGDSSTLGTLIGDVRSPASNGGGHVQTAVKGGTGQTSYIKGDLLVGQGASVLQKLAIGSSNQQLVTDSTAPVGMKWAPITSPKLGVSGSTLSLNNTTSETSLMSVTVPGSVIGTNAAIKARLYMSSLSTNNGNTDALTIRANYGTTSIATIVLSSITSGVIQGSVRGIVEFDIMGANATNAQIGVVNVDFVTPIPYSPLQSFIGIKAMRTLQTTENSDSDKVIGITGQWNVTSTSANVTVVGYIVEKIV